MRPKSLILLLLALGCGLVASIGISQVMQNRNHDQAPVVEMDKILVASHDIKVNEPLSDKNVQLEDWPKEKIPADVVHDIKELENQRAGGIILVGEPIRKAKFAVDNRIQEIPHGYRVVAVPADAVSATGNLLQPGDRVDIVVSIKHGTISQSQVAKTILQNIRVFAINEQWRPTEGNKSDESITAKTVSLLVTPGEAETIALASELGHIRLVLRNPNDEQVADTSGTEENEILTGKTKGNHDQDLTKSGGGILDWLKQQTGSAPSTAPTPASTLNPEEHFTMTLQKGDELSRVEFSRKNKDDRWQNNSVDATGSGGQSSAAVVTPSPNQSPAQPTL
ncbi:MAG TPA: Flp pilus assembly protein CpaB [Pirellulales bacterium]|jgi:pilus assembly protein CpaB|nr:Flp pilus assembly protein CpaB [Pirellulales bacterium]